MQEIPSAAAFKITWLALVALFLGLVGLFAVITVLFAAQRPIVRWERVKALALAALCVVPALAVVLSVFKFGVARVETHSFHGPTNTQWIQQAQTAPTRDVETEMNELGPVGHGPRRVTVETSADDVPAAARERREARAAEKAAATSHIPPISPVTAVLHVQKTENQAPDWAEKEPVPADDGVLVALSSGRFATLAEAEQQIAALAAAAVRDFYREGYSLPGNCTVPVALIEKHAVRECVGEELQKDFGRMYRVHLRLRFDSALRRAVHEAWDGQVAQHRLIGLGGILGAATLLLGTCAAYLKLDDLTGGQYRRRLKLAAAALLAAGGLAVGMLA